MPLSISHQRWHHSARSSRAFRQQGSQTMASRLRGRGCVWRGARTRPPKCVHGSPGEAVLEGVVIGEPGDHAHGEGHEAASRAPARPRRLPLSLAVVETVLVLQRKQQRRHLPTRQIPGCIFNSTGLSGQRGNRRTALPQPARPLPPASLPVQVSTGLTASAAGAPGGACADEGGAGSQGW